MKTRRNLSVIMAAVMLIGLMPSFSVSFAASVDDLQFMNNVESYSVASCNTAASGELVIPEIYNGLPVTSIEMEAFMDCTELTSVIIPNSVNAINMCAFKGCTKLTSVFIPNSVNVIYSEAFMGCTSLESITIPDSVTEINSNVFKDCSKLASITISDSVTNIQAGVFTNTAWYNNQPDGLIYWGKIAYGFKGAMPDNYTMELRNGTETISSNAFGNYSTLVTVIMPNSVTSIGTAAFAGCTELANITIPDSVTEIGMHALLSTAWESAQPDGVVYAGKVAYDYKGTMPDNCTIEFVDGTKTILNNLFSGNKKLINVIIPNSVTRIESFAFGFCSNLASITFPDSATYIDNNAFYDTAWLNNQPNGVVYAGKVAYQYKGTMPNNARIELADGTKVISDRMFSYCSNLKEIIIPNSVTRIGYEAFYRCSALASITLPSFLVSIEERTFESCQGLHSIIIPNSVTSIGNEAFLNCSGLQSITIPNSVTDIGNGAFVGCDDLVMYCYPGSYAESYAIDNGISYSEASGDLTFELNSDGTSYYVSDCNGSASGELIIPETFNRLPVTGIGDNAFESCTRLESITIPDSVTSIGESVFRGCNEDLTVYCFENSPAHSYANENYITVSLIRIRPVSSSTSVIGAGFLVVTANERETVVSNLITAVDGFTAQGIPKRGTVYGTGSTVRVYNAQNEPVSTYTVSLSGDLDGTGTVDALDCMLAELTKSGHRTLTDAEDSTGAFRAANDVNDDGLYNEYDFAVIMNQAIK